MHRLSHCAVAVLLLVEGLWAQTPPDLSTPVVAWRLGDARTLERKSVSTVTANDVLVVSTEVSTKMRLRVLKAGANLYEVEFQGITVNDKVKIRSEVEDTEEMEGMLIDLLAQIQEQVRSFKYILLVDRETGQAVSVKNEEEMAAFLKEVVVVVLDAFMDQSKVELTVAEKDEIKLKLNEVMDEQKDAAMRTIVNAFNYAFQMYIQVYKLGGTYSHQVETYLIDELKYGKRTMQADQKVTATEKLGKLLLQIENRPDQRESYELYVEEGEREEIPFNAFSSIDRLSAEFDLKSSWLLKFTSEIEVKLGEVQQVEKEVTLFKP